MAYSKGVFAIKSRGRILNFTCAESPQAAEEHFREAVDKATQRISERVNESVEAFETRHTHVVDLASAQIKGQNHDRH